MTLQKTEEGSSTTGNDMIESDSKTEMQLDPENTSAEAKPEIDPNLVTWDGPHDPANPKNWSITRKWVAAVLVSAYTFISPVSSSMVAPALGTMKIEFHITNSVESQIFMSIFVLAFAFGPLLVGPLSEVYGRVVILQACNCLYLLFNTLCGIAKTPAQMMVFRFFAGIGGSAPLTVGGGVLNDLFEAESRGRAISIYSLMPLLGPAIGPIIGGVVTDRANWHWVFYSTSIADAVIQIAGFIFLQETFAPVLLNKKRKRLLKKTGNLALRTPYGDGSETLAGKLKMSLQRPLRLLLTQPIVQFVAGYMALLYGLCYLILSSFAQLWISRYHESIEISGINYIALAIGTFIGAQTGAIVTDLVYKKLAARNNGVGLPEFRIPPLFVGSSLVPIGLFWYGWSANATMFWLMPDIGVGIFGCGLILCYICIQTYLMDTYTLYVASALAAVNFLRSLAGFGFALFAPAMYNALGEGWGNSILGFASLGFGFPVSICLWKYGAWLRSKSKYAAGQEN